LSSLTDKGDLARLAVIGVTVLAISGCFAYVAGWLTPSRLTQARVIDRFEEVSGGIHPGFRRNHAKGVCVTGSFESNGQGVRLSKAVVFRPGSVPVVGRFSLAGGDPHMADGPTDVRAMGLSLRPLDGEEWRMAMIDLPVFVVNPFRLRQRRLQRPSCIPVRQCGRRRDARAMVDDRDRAVRTGNTGAGQEPGQELPV
jgi:catalase